MNRGAARQIDWRCIEAKESKFQIVFCFFVTVSPQLWSDAEQIVDNCQI